MRLTVSLATNSICGQTIPLPCTRYMSHLCLPQLTCLHLSPSPLLTPARPTTNHLYKKLRVPVIHTHTYSTPTHMAAHTPHALTRPSAAMLANAWHSIGTPLQQPPSTTCDTVELRCITCTRMENRGVEGWLPHVVGTQMTSNHCTRLYAMTYGRGLCGGMLLHTRCAACAPCHWALLLRHPPCCLQSLCHHAPLRRHGARPRP